VSDSMADRSGDSHVALWDMMRRSDFMSKCDSLDDWSSELIHALGAGMLALTLPVPLRETDAL